MSQRPAAPPPDDATEDASAPTPDLGYAMSGRPAAPPDLAALPVIGITRRRMAAVVGILLAIWIVFTFARQVSEASAATARADDIATTNAGLRSEVAALDHELDLIVRQRYIEQEARGYGLGDAKEIPFALAPDAPALPDDAPGSAAVSLGARSADVSPLERWLTLLFGPTA